MTQDHVLFVDDEQNILNAYRRLFFSDPIDVLTASNAPDGMELIESIPVAVIVSDNVMPGMSGIEFLAWAKSISPESVRILVTGYADLSSAIAAINRSEVYKFITKPWDEADLRQTVLDSVDRYKIVKSIKSSDESTLLAMAQTIELKDPLTKGHCERVAYYAMLLSEAMGLSDDMKTKIKYGSWLHDCGKIGVPEFILNKPGLLDDEQFETIKNHSRWGADVAKAAQLPEPVINIALYHHERYNGAGYPLGLQGHEIPIEARIAAIADSFDAMTTDRPYRRKLSIDDAIKILIEDRGISFDPTMVDLFIKCLSERLDGNGNGC
ncbi:MAG TPA: HD domain-containing phosphohydrolase [Dissulfurispiraceae bacterium]|nr:HD domain-containing phosphohydrolase [Dissulfurispiraceae bacterium]